MLLVLKMLALARAVVVVEVMVSFRDQSGWVAMREAWVTTGVSLISYLIVGIGASLLRAVAGVVAVGGLCCEECTHIILACL